MEKAICRFLKTSLAKKNPMMCLQKLAGIPHRCPQSGSKKTRLHLSETQELAKQGMELKSGSLYENVMWPVLNYHIESWKGGWPGVCSAQPAFFSRGSGLAAELRPSTESFKSVLNSVAQIPSDDFPLCEFTEPHADYEFYNSHFILCRHHKFH